MDNTGLINPQMSEGLNTYTFEPLQTTSVDFYNPTKSYVDGTVNMVSPEKQAANAGLAFIQDQINSKDYLKDTRLTSPTKTKLEPTLRYQDDSLGGYVHNDPRLEFKYGEAQGIPERVFNTFMQFGGNFLSSYLGSFADIPSAVTAIRDGKIESLYNNDLINGLNSISKYGYDNFQIYDTEFTKEHPFLSGKVLGDIFSSVGYSLGSLAGALSEDALVGAATQGIGGAVLASTQLAKLLAKANKIFNGTEEGMNAFRTAIRNGEKIEDAIEKAAKFTKIKNGLFTANLITNGMFEAAIESKETQEQVQKKIEQDFYDKNGYTATGDDLKEIQDTVNDATNFTYFTNVALLAVSNKLQFGDLMLKWKLGKEGFEATEKGLIRLAAKKGSVDTVEKIGEKEAATTLLGKTGEFLNNSSNFILKSSGEMLEEGGQFATQQAALDYYPTKFNKDGLDGTANLLNSVAKGIGKTFTTEEGWINMIAGLGGGLVSSVVTRAIGLEPSKKNQSERMDRLQEFFNDPSKSSSLKQVLLNKIKQNIQDVGVRKQANESSRVNDAKAAGDVITFNWVNAALDSGQFDLRLEQLENARNLSKEDFEREFGMEFNDQNVSEINDYIDKVKEEAESIKNYREKIDLSFRNPFTKRFGNDIESQIKSELYEDYKKEMVFQLYKQNINKVRYDDILNKLDDDPSNIDINFAVNFATIGRLALTEDNLEYEVSDPDIGIISIMQKYKERHKELSDKEDAYNNAKDKSGLIPLSVYEKKELNDLNDLLKTYSNIAATKQNGEEVLLEEKASLLKKANDLENRKTFNKTKKSIGALKAREIITYGYELARIKAHADKAEKTFEMLTSKEGFDKFSKKAKEAANKIKKEAEKAKAKNSEKNPNTSKPNSQNTGRQKITPSGKYIADITDPDTRTMDEVEAHYNFNDKPTEIAITDLLDKLLSAKGLRPSYIPIINKMKSSPTANTKIKIYNGKGTTIASVKTELNSATNTYEYTIRYDMSVDSLGLVERSLLHELVHVYTIQGLAVDGNYQTKIKELLEVAKNTLKADSNGAVFYGLTDEYEFVAEALTNSEFQKALANIPYKGRNLWETLTNAIMKFLGITGSSNVLEEVLSLTKIEIETKSLSKTNNSDLFKKAQTGIDNYSKLNTTEVYDSASLLSDKGFFTQDELDQIESSNSALIIDKFPIKVEDNKIVYAVNLKTITPINNNTNGTSIITSDNFKANDRKKLFYSLRNTIIPYSKLALNPDFKNLDNYIYNIVEKIKANESASDIGSYIDSLPLFKNDNEIKYILYKLLYMEFNPLANKTKAANIDTMTHSGYESYWKSLNGFKDFLFIDLPRLYENAKKVMVDSAKLLKAVGGVIQGKTSTSPAFTNQDEIDAVKPFNTYIGKFAPLFNYFVNGIIYLDNNTLDFKISDNSKIDPKNKALVEEALSLNPIVLNAVFNYLDAYTYMNRSNGYTGLLAFGQIVNSVYAEVTKEVSEIPVKPLPPKSPSGSNIRDSLPDSQSNTRSEVTKILLDYFADVLGIPKYTEDLNLGKYLSWIKEQNINPNFDLLQELPNLLNAPKKAYDYITKAKEEIEKRNKNLGGQSKEKSKEYKRLLSLIRKNITINNIENFYSGDELIQKIEDIINAYESSDPSLEQIGLAFNDVKSLLDQIILDDSGFSRAEEILNNINFKINPKSFDRFSDKNLRDNSVNLNFISNNGSDVDTLAQELEIEPQDIIDYILKYKNKKPKNSENLHKSKNKLIKVIESLIQGKLDTDVVNGIYNLEITAVNEVDISYDELPILKEKLAKLKAQKNKGQQPQNSFNINEFISKLYVFSNNTSDAKPGKRTLEVAAQYAKEGVQKFIDKIVMVSSEFTIGNFKAEYDKQQASIEKLKSGNQTLIAQGLKELNKAIIKNVNGYSILSLKLPKSRIFGYYNDENTFINVGALQSTSSYAYVSPNGEFKYFYDLKDPVEYVNVTGMPLESFEEFRNSMEMLKAFETELDSKKRMNRKEFEKFIELTFNNGSFDTVSTNDYLKNPTKFRELVIQGVPFANGVKPVFLSMKEVYNVNDDGEVMYSRTPPVLITDSDISIKDPEYIKLQKFIGDNLNLIMSLDVRYAAIVKFGDSYEIIATRPTSLSISDKTKLDDIVQQIKEKSKNSVRNRAGKASDKEKEDYKKWNNEFQSNFYIADDNLKFAYYLGVTLKGELQLRIVNLLNKEEGVLKVPGTVVDKLNTIDDLVNLLNHTKSNNRFQNFFSNVSPITIESFKNYIVNDDKIDATTLANSVTTSVKGNIRNINAKVTYKTNEKVAEDIVAGSVDETNDSMFDVDMFADLGATEVSMTVAEAAAIEDAFLNKNKTNTSAPASNSNVNTGEINISNSSLTETAKSAAKNNDDIENLFKVKEKAKNLSDSQLDMLAKKHIKQCK